MTGWKTGAYGLESRRIGRFEITVIWDSCVSRDAPDEQRGYKVTFERLSLKKRFGSEIEAKAAGEKLAQTVLRQALTELEASL